MNKKLVIYPPEQTYKTSSINNRININTRGDSYDYHQVGFAYNDNNKFFLETKNLNRVLDRLKKNLDNETLVPKDSQEESPDQKQEESEEVPVTIFQ